MNETDVCFQRKILSKAGFTFSTFASKVEVNFQLSTQIDNVNSKVSSWKGVLKVEVNVEKQKDLTNFVSTFVSIMTKGSERGSLTLLLLIIDDSETKQIE